MSRKLHHNAPLCTKRWRMITRRDVGEHTNPRARHASAESASGARAGLHDATTEKLRSRRGRECHDRDVLARSRVESDRSCTSKINRVPVSSRRDRPKLIDAGGHVLENDSSLSITSRARASAGERLKNTVRHADAVVTHIKGDTHERLMRLRFCTQDDSRAAVSDADRGFWFT